MFVDEWEMDKAGIDFSIYPQVGMTEESCSQVYELPDTFRGTVAEVQPCGFWNNTQLFTEDAHVVRG